MYDFETVYNVKEQCLKKEIKMKTKMPIEMKMSVISVTPNMALAWLQKNICNRAISKLVVNRYINDMKAGKWMVTPHGIVFDCDMNLLDGQHRLTAIAESGCTVKMTVILNADPDSKWYIDIQRRRGGAAVTQMLGIKSSTNVAAVVQKVGEILLGAKTKRELPNDSAAVILARIGEDLHECTSIVNNFCAQGSAKKNSAYPAIYWLCSLHFGKEKTDSVFSKIIAGYDLSPKSREALVRKNVILTKFAPGVRGDGGDCELMKLMKAIMPLMSKGNSVETSIMNFRNRVKCFEIIEVYEDGFRRTCEIYNNYSSYKRRSNRSAK